MSETLTTSRFETPTRARVMEALEAAKEKRDAFRREARAVLRATTGAVGEDNQMRRNLRRAVDAEAREWRDAMQKPSALKQMLETREPSFFTPASRAGAASVSQSTAAQPHPFKVITSGSNWGVHFDSHLFGSLKPNDALSITGLLSEDRSSGWIAMGTDDAIWLEIELDSGGDVVGADINSLGGSGNFSLSAAAWASNAYVTKDAGDAYQEYARVLIAYRPGSGEVVQVLRADLVLRHLCIDGVPAIYPFAHTGGYVA